MFKAIRLTNSCVKTNVHFKMGECICIYIYKDLGLLFIVMKVYDSEYRCRLTQVIEECYFP